MWILFFFKNKRTHKKKRAGDRKAGLNWQYNMFRYYCFTYVFVVSEMPIGFARCVTCQHWNFAFLLASADSSDIVKGNLKLILGLIWTLILKYQISMPYMDDEPEAGGQKMTPKQALLSWVKSKMPESVPMDNFTNHWNDGRAVACLVDAVAPGLLPECEDLDPKDALENATNAMALARDWLDVPTVGVWIHCSLFLVMSALKNLEDTYCIIWLTYENLMVV